MAGDRAAASAAFAAAARYATNVPEKRYLERKLAELGAGQRRLHPVTRATPRSPPSRAS
jgi:hypothetical protein